MNAFPAIDPIPLPAPIWLFKALHIVTLALHFFAVELLLGGLLVAVWLSFLGSRNRRHPAATLRLTAAAALGRRLPIVVTYVINLGVPPLLFAQVLYGRALYTSSVLLGAYWIAVIFLLMGCYWHIYRFSAFAESGRNAAWVKGLVGWVLAIIIAGIYSTNMTLMLRPEVWASMYAASPTGLRLPPHDPTLLVRWLFMLTGGFWVAGIWMIWLAGRRVFEDPVRRYLSATGGRLAVVMLLVQGVMAWQVLATQTPGVRETLFGAPLYLGSAWAWAGSAAAILIFAAWASIAKPVSKAAGWTGAVLTLVCLLGAVLVRDGIRDFTLLAKGYDVWERTVVTNWPVVGLFLALFVAGLGALAWLISVMMRARPVAERAT